MPRYKYCCEECNNIVIVVHSINEKYEESCNLCEASMKKVFANNFTTKKNNKNKKTKIGQITKEYIEENKQILDKQKQEAMSESYE
jgi:putative FmdB family regulatory protein